MGSGPVKPTWVGLEKAFNHKKLIMISYRCLSCLWVRQRLSRSDPQKVFSHGHLRLKEHKWSWHLRDFHHHLASFWTGEEGIRDTKTHHITRLGALQPSSIHLNAQHEASGTSEVPLDEPLMSQKGHPITWPRKQRNRTCKTTPSLWSLYNL